MANVGSLRLSHVPLQSFRFLVRAKAWTRSCSPRKTLRNASCERARGGWFKEAHP